MDWIALLVGFAIVAGAVFIYLTTLRRSQEAAAAQAARRAVSYPLQLQAAERMVLFLERIKPNNLLTRLGTDHSGVIELQELILREIRTELDHNAAQQLYLGKAVWDKITTAATTTSAALVHAVAQRSDLPDARAIVVSILKNEDETVTRLIREALDAIKEEVQQNF